MQRKHLKYYLRVKALFKDMYGNPFKMTEGQCEIFRIVYEHAIKRGVIKATTQYGKSEITSMAIICVMIERQEKILIVAPSIKQAEIIMGNVIKHFFDHPLLEGMIEHTGQKEKLKQERSRKRIVTINGSEVMILTAEATTLAKEAKSLMGFGASMVVVDESCLIPDQIFGKILRMVGGYKGGRLIQLSNPFEKNHFYKAFHQDRYEKLTIDYKQALKEGRLDQEFLDEAKETIGDLEWLVFYECKFPDGGNDNALIPPDWVLMAVNNDIHVDSDAWRQGGLDVARFGRDKTVLIVRKGGKVETTHSTSNMDTMAVVGWSSKIIDNEDLDTLGVDIVGIGSGVYDRLDELGYDVIGINVGAGPTDEEAKNKFFNLRAQVHWNLRKWFKPDRVTGKPLISIPNDPELIAEINAITYKYSSEKKIRIESKDEIKKKLGRSPDKADALSLAFFDLTEDDAQIIII